MDYFIRKDRMPPKRVINLHQSMNRMITSERIIQKTSIYVSYQVSLPVIIVRRGGWERTSTNKMDRFTTPTEEKRSEFSVCHAFYKGTL